MVISVLDWAENIVGNRENAFSVILSSIIMFSETFRVIKTWVVKS